MAVIQTFEWDITIPDPPKELDSIEGWGLARYDQYFRPPKVPYEWSPESIKRQAETKYLVDGKPDYEWYKTRPTPEMRAFQVEEMRRRINGYDFMNNGQYVHITGDQYFYLVYWLFDTGRPDYRQRDWKWFNFLEYGVVLDPLCYGMIEPKARRMGESAKGNSTLLNRATSTELINCGIQNMTEDDAKKHNFRPIQTILKRFPLFAKPEVEPTQKELRFTTGFRKSAFNTIENYDGLDSIIDYEATVATAYDGRKLHFALIDEGGKMENVDISELWGVLKQCLRVGTKIVGKAIMPTTVEELTRKGGNTYEKLFNGSARHKIGELGQTPTGLKRLFFPAWEGYEGFIDRFGNSVIDAPTPEQQEYLVEVNKGNPTLVEAIKKGMGAKAYLFAELENVKAGATSPADVAKWRRKFPFDVDDCFRASDKECYFDIEVLNDRERFLQNKGEPCQTFDLEWEDKKRFSKVEIKPKSNGKWKMTNILADDTYWKDVRNNVVPSGLGGANMWKPGNIQDVGKGKFFTIGLDPYDSFMTTNAESYRRSNSALYVFWKFDRRVDLGQDMLPKPIAERKSYSFILEYVHRTQKPSEMYEDVLKTCWYFGTPVLIEGQKAGGIQLFFEQNGCWLFLSNKPKGVTTTDHKTLAQADMVSGYKGIAGSTQLHEAMLDEHMEYVADHGQRIPFLRLVKGLIDLNPDSQDSWRESDEVVGSGLCLVQGSHLRLKPENPEETTKFAEVDWFPRYDKQSGRIIATR